MEPATLRSLGLRSLGLRSAVPLMLSLGLGLFGLWVPMASAQIQSGGVAHEPTLLSGRFRAGGRSRQTVGSAKRGMIKASVVPCSVGGSGDVTAALPPEGLLMLLVPLPLPGEEYASAVTIAERPTLLLHVPDRGGYIVDVSLTSDIETIYQGTFTLPASAGIVQLQLPSSLPALAIDKPYDLALTLFCDRRDLRQVRTLRYPITRVVVPPTVHPQATGDPLQFANDLAEAGIWFEAVSSLATLRRVQPTSPVLQSEWRELLQSVGLDGLADQPLLDCCPLPEPSPR